MKDFLRHTQMYIFRGFIAIIPLFLCYLALKLLYILIDKNVMAFLNRFIDIRQIPGLGIVLVLIFLYFIGLVFSNIIGRQIFRLIDRISHKIPFIGAVYAVGKQLSDSLEVTGDKQAFKKAVLVNLKNEGIWLPGFVTGSVFDPRSKEELTVVFIPHVPNPVTGFVTAVKPSQVFEPGWSVEECLKIVVSAGIITPKLIDNK